MQTAQTILILLGCALSLPIFWWLFISPFVRFCSQYRAGKPEAKPLDSPRD